jgi:hypothetical protein
MNRLLTAAALVLALTSPAPAGSLGGVAVFGGNSADIENNVSGGLSVSNGNVNVGAFVTADGLSGNTLTGGSGFVVINGPVTFNSDISGSPFGFSGTINGPINSGGNVGLNATTQNITAAGNVNLQFDTTNGNILAGGNVSVAAFSVVNGNVTANGSISTSSAGQISGTVTQFAGVPVNPVPYAPITLTADKFTAGGSSITTGVNLPPGSYGDLNIPGFGGTLTLSAGNYFFTSFHIDGAFDTLNFDLSKGPINVFVTGDISFGSFLTVTVNGTAAFINNGPNPANESLASQVFFETLGNVNDGNPFGSNFYGTLFAPNGDITTAFGAIIGSLIGGGNVTNGFESPVFYVGSDRLTAIPEPPSLVLGLAAALSLVGFRCWRYAVPGRRAVGSRIEANTGRTSHCS